MTFPDNNQPDLPFAAVGSQGFISALTGRRIWGYLSLPTSVAMPVTAVSLDDRTVIEFEVGTPPTDTPLPIKLDAVGVQISSNPILKSGGRAGESAKFISAPPPFRDLEFSHGESIDVDAEREAAIRTLEQELHSLRSQEKEAERIVEYNRDELRKSESYHESLVSKRMGIDYGINALYQLVGRERSK